MKTFQKRNKSEYALTLTDLAQTEEIKTEFLDTLLQFLSTKKSIGVYEDEASKEMKRGYLIFHNKGKEKVFLDYRIGTEDNPLNLAKADIKELNLIIEDKKYACQVEGALKKYLN